ncbi:hypothetical protein FQR65_LT03560 [Abscondita terminalis]|nr:hypothetical protein FQR65_LT03560 [Abscondita terminalis]
MIRPLRMLEHQMRVAEEFFPRVVYPMMRNNKNNFFVEVCDGEETISQNKDKFQVKLDVKNFAPEVIVVKAVDGNSIVIEAKQEKTDGGGSVLSRQFFRKFVLSKDHDLKNVESSLSTDGILTVTAPNKNKESREFSSGVTELFYAMLLHVVLAVLPKWY